MSGLPIATEQRTSREVSNVYVLVFWAIDFVSVHFWRAEHAAVGELRDPLYECFARAFTTDPTKKVSQKQVISDLNEMINNTPLMKDEPLEMFSLMYFIDDHFFQNCLTPADAQMFGP